jgi:DNA-binding IclR family transcriptional regulator
VATMQAESNPEVAILHFVRSLEREQPLTKVPPLMTLGSLARQLGIQRRRCREALYELVHCGELRALRHSGGFYRLWTTL